MIIYILSIIAIMACIWAILEIKERKIHQKMALAYKSMYDSCDSIRKQEVLQKRICQESFDMLSKYNKELGNKVKNMQQELKNLGAK